MPIRKVKRICLLLAVVTVVFAVASYMWEPLAIVALIGFIAYLVIRYRYYRCPHCGRYLGRDTGDYCRRCGKRIDQ